MCLIANHKTVKIAKKNIICYKEVLKSGRLLESPHRGAFYRLNAFNFADRFVCESSNDHQNVYRGLHSYKSIKDLGLEYPQSTILKCTIPKGALYYEGRHNGDGYGYASNYLYVELYKGSKKSKRRKR